MLNSLVFMILFYKFEIILKLEFIKLLLPNL